MTKFIIRREDKDGFVEYFSGVNALFKANFSDCTCVMFGSEEEAGQCLKQLITGMNPEIVVESVFLVLPITIPA